VTDVRFRFPFQDFLFFSFLGKCNFKKIQQQKVSPNIIQQRNRNIFLALMQMEKRIICRLSHELKQYPAHGTLYFWEPGFYVCTASHVKNKELRVKGRRYSYWIK